MKVEELEKGVTLIALEPWERARGIGLGKQFNEFIVRYTCSNCMALHQERVLLYKSHNFWTLANSAKTRLIKFKGKEPPNREEFDYYLKVIVGLPIVEGSLKYWELEVQET